VFPRLFTIHNFSLHTYGVLAAVGLILGLVLNVRLAKRDGIDEERAWNLGILAIFASIIGAKLLLVINDFSYYAANPKVMFSTSMLQAGGVWYGGVIGGLLASFVYMRIQRMPILRVCDSFMPGVAVGHGIGRLGCFAAGCCYGKPTDVAWGVTFTNPLANQLVGTPLGVKLHPTQLYEFLAEMLIFAVLLWLWKRKSFDGQVFGTYLFLYGIVRYFSEFYRDDPERGSLFNGAMTVTQFISICLVIIGGMLWMKRGPRAEAVSA
jgi:phosphatidylglycerol---prolipoprotein diacylglyceryl transferase